MFVICDIYIYIYIYTTESPVGFFRVEFCERIQSRYRSTWLFRTGLTQEDILMERWDDVGRRHEVVDVLARTPHLQYHLFQENPLNHGYYLSTITANGMH